MSSYLSTRTIGGFLSRNDLSLDHMRRINNDTVLLKVSKYMEYNSKSKYFELIQRQGEELRVQIINEEIFKKAHIPKRNNKIKQKNKVGYDSIW